MGTHGTHHSGRRQGAAAHAAGFTLVELTVVVLIIGILVAIALPVYRSVTASTSRSACLGTQRAIQSAIETYKAGNPTAPQFNDVFYVGEQTTGDNWSTRLIPAYFASAPKCKDPTKLAAGAQCRGYYIDSADWYDSGVNKDDIVVGCIWTPDSGYHWRLLWQ